MDSERVRAYLQIACAGLGFDIGEVWWTSNENAGPASSIEAAPNQNLVRNNECEAASKGLRFVQLYTSKSYESRRSELVNPPTDDTDDSDINDNIESNASNGKGTANHNGYGESVGKESQLSANHLRSTSADNLQKHVLSPRLVDAIAKTTQVVWANSKRREGLIGRSDIRLQTAVGMPVAMDDMGNMCVVVMFSPNNIQSTDDAIEYLQSISRSAMTSSIPCMLPVFDRNTTTGTGNTNGARGDENQLTYLALHHHNMHGDKNSLGEGVTARFVSFYSNGHGGDTEMADSEGNSAHELSHAPKDTFGIPMLPTFAELGNVIPDYDNVDIFDEASYGIWSTIMDTMAKDNTLEDNFNDSMDFTFDATAGDSVGIIADQDQDFNLPGNAISECRKSRLEEFCTAFLDMSVFDLADVWLPAGTKHPDCLRHVTSVTSTDRNVVLDDFLLGSSNTLIGIWQGAVGRAYSSGNPVWSANRNVFADPGRSGLFTRSKIMTVLAVPVFSGKSSIPACVVACYSLVRSGSVPFVLRFVQQALRLLWDGLDTLVESHENEERKLWQDVAPADLGEMAADVEMQHHFMKKKRPHSVISDSSEEPTRDDPCTSTLAGNLQAVCLPNGETVHVPFELPPEPKLSIPPCSTPSFNLVEIHHQFQEAVLSTPGIVPSSLSPSHPPVPKSSSFFPFRPLSMPHSFPTTVVSSDSTVCVSKPSPGPVQEPFSVNTAVFVFPQQMFGLRQHTSEVDSPQHNQTIAPVTSIVTAVSPVSDSRIYCMTVNVNDNNPPCLSQEVLSFGNKRCRIVGCDELCVARRPYCVPHSGNRQCEFDGCTKCAQGSTRFCIAHGGGRRCTHPGCDKGARDKFFCAAHGGGKRCRSFDCNKSAVGGSTYCTAHGGGKRCDVEGCDKSAQSSTKFCVKHGGGKKCSHEGCEKVARGRTNFCAAHGGGVRCKLEGCNRVAIGKLQLCRAHGGGARMKRPHKVVQSETATSSPPPSPPSSFMLSVA